MSTKRNTWRHEFKRGLGSTIVVCNQTGQHIATVHKDTKAPLVAAAPELLDALEAVARRSGVVPRDLELMVSAAIAKATGSAP